MSKEKDVTKGAETMIAEGPVVEVAGREYVMRRLGVRHTFAFARIIASGAAYLGKEVGSVFSQIQDGEGGAEAIGTLVLLGIPYSEKQAMSLLADVIGVSEEEFGNPELFPIGSELEIIKGLVDHQDLKAFFDQLKNLFGSPGMQSLVGSRKTSSSAK